jgi:hypothetical protein
VQYLIWCGGWFHPSSCHESFGTEDKNWVVHFRLYVLTVENWATERVLQDSLENSAFKLKTNISLLTIKNVELIFYAKCSYFLSLNACLVASGPKWKVCSQLNCYHSGYRPFRQLVNLKLFLLLMIFEILENSAGSIFFFSLIWGFVELGWCFEVVIPRIVIKLDLPDPWFQVFELGKPIIFFHIIRCNTRYR